MDELESESSRQSESDAAKGINRCNHHEGILGIGQGHGASAFMWGIIAASTEKKPDNKCIAEWNRPFERVYEYSKLCGRYPQKGQLPIKYALIRRRYQTHYNFRDFAPFSGMQTWAFADEPPIVHPTIMAPSTTQAWGLDTARQSVSANWGLYGAGLKGNDFRFMGGGSRGAGNANRGSLGAAKTAEAARASQNPAAISFLVARYDMLWRLVFFTDYSTVQLEFGRHRERKVLWTLNRVQPAVPRIESQVVAFEGRQGRIYASVAAKPRLLERDAAGTDGTDQSPANGLRGVRALEYECGTGPAAFALSCDGFRFISAVDNVLETGAFEFADCGGVYRIKLAKGFLDLYNPGNISHDSYILAQETEAVILD